MIKKRLGLIILGLFCAQFSFGQSFAEMQLRHERVQKAFQTSNEVLKAKFESAGISYPPKFIYWRAFKGEQELELWAGDDRYKSFKLIDIYNICRLSGVLGFKGQEGDEQIPEGAYYINYYNPYSSYHLSFRLSYPNGVDSFWGYRPKLGGQIFVHGDCATIGCLPMTDSVMGEIYWATVQAQSHQGFVAKVPVHVFPFRPENKEVTLLNFNVKGDINLNEKRWSNLYFAYHHFERAKFPARASHNRKGFYMFDTLPPKKPRILLPIYWSPRLILEQKAIARWKAFKLRRSLKGLAPISRDYVIDINKASISQGKNYRLNVRYEEIDPKPGEWRPANAPKRYRKVVDTVYTKLNP